MARKSSDRPAALITGGAKGMGRAIAIALAEMATMSASSHARVKLPRASRWASAKNWAHMRSIGKPI